MSKPLSPARSRAYLTLLGYTFERRRAGAYARHWTITEPEGNTHTTRTLADPQCAALGQQLRDAACERARQQHWSAAELIELWDHIHQGDTSDEPALPPDHPEYARVEAGWWLRYADPISAFEHQHASIRLTNGSYGPFLNHVKTLIEGALQCQP